MLTPNMGQGQSHGFSAHVIHEGIHTCVCAPRRKAHPGMRGRRGVTELARLLGHMLALDVQQLPTPPASGVSSPGNARMVVGRLHLRELGDTCGTMVGVDRAAAPVPRALVDGGKA